MPHENHDLTPAESELESALAHLLPTPPRDHRDTIAYEAGLRAGRRSLTPWRTSTATLAASLALSLLLHIPTTPHPSPQLASLPTPPSPHLPISYSPPNPQPNTYLALRDNVLSHGLTALPPSTSSSPTEEPARAFTIQPYSSKLPALFGEHL